jgi:hypothetical protein
MVGAAFYPFHSEERGMAAYFYLFFLFSEGSGRLAMIFSDRLVDK